MPKNETSESKSKAKSLKNIYTSKISKIFKLTKAKYGSFLRLNDIKNSVDIDRSKGWHANKKQFNKDAARKARARKRIYVELLEQAVQNLRQLNKEGQYILNLTDQILQELHQNSACKKLDEIGQYLAKVENEKYLKDYSLATMDMERECQLTKIVGQISRISLPNQIDMEKVQNLNKTVHFTNILDRIKKVYQQLPELYYELNAICSQHASLHVMCVPWKQSYYYNPYIGKTLMEEYYSQCMCRKDITSIETAKYIKLLEGICEYCQQVRDNIQ